MFDWTTIMKKKASKYLNPGEEYLAASAVDAPGVMTRGMGAGVGGVVGITAMAASHNAAVDSAEYSRGEGSVASGLPVRKAVIAVTNQRLLMFSYGGMVTLKVKELLHEVPRSQVSHAAFSKGKLLDKIELTFVDGSVAKYEIGRAAKLGVVADALGVAA